MHVRRGPCKVRDNVRDGCVRRQRTRPEARARTYVEPRVRQELRDGDPPPGVNDEASLDQVLGWGGGGGMRVAACGPGRPAVW